MRFARTVIAAAVAALTVPVVLAGPAHADNDVIHIRLDPASGWTWSGTLYAFNTAGLVASKNFTVGPGGGLQDVMDVTVDSLTNYSFWIYDSTLTGGGVTGTVDIQAWVHNDAFQDLYLSTQVSKGDVPMAANLGKFGSDDYELKFYPIVDAPTAQNVQSATDVNTAQARAKNSGHVTLQPGRVTAMAERFIAAPGDVINIHGYGPDRETALARAEHVRDHLLAEITRLGGDPANYPTFVVYGGDPGHKKNVHVTIHQHAASSITVPEGGTLTIGGNS
jgi:hypothetical protein